MGALLAFCNFREANIQAIQTHWKHLNMNLFWLYMFYIISNIIVSWAIQ